MPFLTRAVVIVAALTMLPVAAAAPAVEVTPAGLRASGLTPGAGAVWFGTTVDTFAMTRRLKVHARILSDPDRDGSVTYEMPAISRFSLFIVVDSATGEYAIYRAEGVGGIELDLRGNNWRAGLEHFDVPADSLEILLVRPGVGAWTMSATEGDRNDRDGAANGKFRLKIQDMRPIAGDGKPQGGVRRGDLIVFIEPRSFEYAVRPAKD